jgi:hypothetical protein
MSKASMTFKLEGSDKDGGAVLFKDFRTFLDDVANCLRRIQDRIGSERVRYRITDLKAGSAIVTLEGMSPRKSPGAAQDVHDTFARTVRALESGDRPDSRLRPDDLKAFRKLAQPVLNGEKRVEVAGIPLTTQYVANIDNILGGGVRSTGTVKGRVEKLNVHYRNEFTLFPPIGNYSVRCVFPESLFEKVQESIKRSVTVFGILTYSSDSPYPDGVRVESMEIHPPDESLPSLNSLKGTLPGATNGKTSVEFVEALRNE